uniref:Protein CLP1 homolog n=1 Tax=Arcella intermedia TaxID=1963864 RepID=A0A6B2L5X8_9EUKA
MPMMNELRFEVKSGQNLKVKLRDGLAECFGTELAKGKVYTFSDCNSCIFTWQGCVLEMDGECHSYVADETPMNMYLNAHVILQQKRERARETNTAGPKVVVVGSTDSGKSSLCRLLCNYAARLGESVTYVDLDIGQGSITLPGMISAIPLDRPYDLEDGFGMSAPLSFFYGDVDASLNPKLYAKQVQNLAAVVNRRLQENRNAAASGAIINTMGWVDGQGYQLLCEAVDAFVPDVILVIAHERLYSDLVNDMGKKHPALQIVKMPKSGGVVTRDQSVRRKARSNRIREYFYGRSGELCPHSTVIPFHNIRVLKTNVGPQAPISALPIGMQPRVDLIKPREVTPSSELLHSILGVSLADNNETLIETNLAGFLYVTDFNEEKKTITALAPCPGPLPSKFVLLGNLKYLE